MSDDTNYLINYKTDQLYTYPATKGTYATIVGDSEEVIGEIDVTPRCKLAVIGFYVQERRDFNSFKIVKLRFHKTRGWLEDGQVNVNNFQVAQMRDFISVISALDLSDSKKTRLSLNNVDADTLGSLLNSTQGAALIGGLAANPHLHQDIYAIAAKREAIAEFEAMLQGNTSEPAWQAYFERNPWVFGHGLNYIFLDRVGPKLEARTTGNTFDRPGKTVDALMRTRAEISQYVLVEIKKSSTELVQTSEYRAGCWGVSGEVSDAVTQIQKTAFEFARDHFRDPLRDTEGNDVGVPVYSVEPRTFLIIGNSSELRGNDHKIACFELYRRNIRSPEIITFDELYYRARCIVENISRSIGQNN